MPQFQRRFPILPQMPNEFLKTVFGTMGAKVDKRRLSDISPLKQFLDFNSTKVLKTRRNAPIGSFIANRFPLLQYRFP
jgi:hypothetical protein